MKAKKLLSVLLTIMMMFTLMLGATTAFAATPDKNVSSIEGSNILLIGDYAFNLSDPANSNYTLNNFLVAAKTAYLNPTTGKYEVYFKIGDKWFDVVSDPTMATLIPDVSKINGDGLFNFTNMDETPAPVVDKIALTDAISAANTNKTTAVVSADGSDVLPANKWVLQADLDTYTAAITAAQAVVDNADATQTAVNDAVAALATATTAFDSAKADGTQVPVTPVTPAAPSVTNDDIANTVAGMAAGMEYKLDGAEYVAYDSAAFGLIDFSGDHVLLVRVAAEGINPAGLDTTLTFTTNPVPAPVITNVSIASSNADITKAVYGDIITLKFASNEPVTKLSGFKINGSNPDTFTNVGNDYTATHLVDSGDVVTGVPATFQINVQNAAGIYSLTVEETTDGSSVTIAEPTPITGPLAEEYVKPQDFGYASDIDAEQPGGQPAFNVGFQLQLAKLTYADITKIEVSLVDATNGQTLVTRTATGAQLAQLQADDVLYSGGEDGQLSVAFIQRDVPSVNAWWNSTPYDFTTPSTAVIKVTTTNHNTYIVENSTLLGDPIPVAPTTP